MKPIALLLATTMAFSPAVTCAQQAANTPVAVAQATAATTATSSSPLSLARVQRQLLATEVGKPTEGDHIRIEEFINVYGKSIALDVMRDYDVKATAVQYGGMTHTEFLDGTVLDYDTSLISKGFLINNPKAKSTCGCGVSFSVS